MRGIVETLASSTATSEYELYRKQAVLKNNKQSHDFLSTYEKSLRGESQEPMAYVFAALNNNSTGTAHKVVFLLEPLPVQTSTRTKRMIEALKKRKCYHNLGVHNMISF